MNDPMLATHYGLDGRRRLGWIQRFLLLALVLGLGGPMVSPAAAAPMEQNVEPAYSYELVDTWENVPWELTPGRFGRVSDISSAPDGTIYVLDSRHRAIHALTEDGVPLRVFKIPEDLTGQVFSWTPLRIDVGFDGNVYCLMEGRFIDPNDNRLKYKFRVIRLSSIGEELYDFEWMPEDFPDAKQGRYLDIAVRPDGRIYVSRSAVNAFIQFTGCDPATGEAQIVDSGVDIFDAVGDYQETIEFHIHGSIPTGIDVDKDGRLHAINAIPGVLANPYCGPQPTEEPSFLRGPDAALSAPGLQGLDGIDQDEEPDRWPAGVAIFEPNHDLKEIVEFYNAEDIAVGPAGVFISRNVEIFQLRDGEPLFAGPTGQVQAAYFGRIVFYLDAHRNGNVLAGMAHCFYMGVLIFENPGARPDEPIFAGSTDAPELEGPVYPARLAAAEDVAILLGRYNTLGARPNQRYQGTAAIVLPQTVQRWTRHGEVVPPESPLRSQLGMCVSGLTWFTRDVAIDDDIIYSVDFAQLHRRPNDALPDWTTWPGILEDPDAPSRLSAVSADSHRVAVLDEGTGKVHVVDEEGDSLFGWEADTNRDSVPVDLAMHGDRIYLADRGRNRILIRDSGGRDLGEFATHDGPISVAAGPSGDIYVLGRGKWAYRYSPDGSLLASWPLPDRSIWALDITVDDDEKVYVSFLEHSEIPDSPLPSIVTNQFGIERSGVWIFEARPYVRPVVPDPDPDACIGLPDKWAEPYRIPLGDTVDVSLTVDGRCPGRQLPVQVAIVFDTSRSMSFNNAIERSKNAVSNLLGELNPQTAEVALISFDNGATLEQPLTSNISSVMQQVAGLDPLGDTRSTAGLSAALAELQGVRGDASERQVILLVTDGVLKDSPLVEADEVRNAGVDLYAIVTPNNEYTQQHQQILIQMVGGLPERVVSEPDPAEILALAHDFARYRETDGLWDTITITDEIPDNMTYIDGSAQPPAAYNSATHTLTWVFSNIMAAQNLSMTYKLEPEEVGIWPTNVQAVADYTDALGNDGQLIFPIPEVEVWTKDYFAYLPFGAARTCVPSDKPLDIVLVMDTSSSMREPAASGTGTKLDAAREAAGAFLGNLTFGERRDKAAIVSFNLEAGRVVDLTADEAALMGGLARLESVQGTRIDLGLEKAREALLFGMRADAKPVIILLTDGLQNQERAPNSAVLGQATALKDLGALVYTIGLGNQIDIALLEAAANSADRFYRSPSSDQLADIYAQISERITCDLQDG